jgi:hypothetical protein
MARRPWLLALLLAAVALPAPVLAGVPVGLYPVQSEGLTDAERAEVQAVVESAIQGADRRGVLEPRAPLVVPGNCKAPITVGCVATFAKGGVVLYAKAKRRGAAINVTVLFVDATGRKTRAVAFPIDLFIQNLRPANDAIATIEAELAAGNLEDSTPPPPPAALARPSEPERAAAGEPPAPAAPAPAPAATATRPEPAEPAAEHAAKATAPIDLAARPKAEPAPARGAKKAPTKAPVPEPPAGDWKTTAGRWTTGGGVAMLVAGAVVGLTGKRLADSLQDRYDRGALRPEDEPLFDKVDRYERLANILFVAGGAFSVAGLTLQAMAPAGGGAGVAMAGTF